MTRYSQNGYSACDSSVIAKYTVPGSKVTVNIRKGDVSVVLLDFAGWYNANIEALRQSDTGGYNCRDIEGSSTLSNHASGTAIDLRWNDHPRGKRNAGFNSTEISKINNKLKEYGGVIRWGNNYNGTPDAMHFEINAGSAAVKKQADRIRAKGKPSTGGGSSKPSGSLPHYADGSRENSRSKNNVGTDVKTLQVFIGSARCGSPDGHYGPNTERGVRWYQDMRGLSVDGVAGPHTWAPILHALKEN
jgi:hypothetical protein